MISKYAEMLRFELTDSEVKEVQKNFEVFLKQLEFLKISYEDIVYEVKDVVLREDIFCESTNIDELFSNAKYIENNEIKVPKVI